MKKFLVCLMGVLLALTPLTLVGCKKTDSRTIRLSEVTHSIFYAPMYVAIENGYFAKRDLKIELSNGGGADKVMTAITSKSADIGFMGPEATIYCHVNGQKDYPIIFGQLTQRDGSFLLSKKDEPDFKWTNLKGKRVLAGRPGGVPAMALQYAVEKNGLSLDEFNFDTTVAFNLQGSVFDSDATVDYTTLFEPTASEFASQGKGYVVASVGEAAGYVAYTAYSASKSYMEKNPEIIESFLEAIFEGYNYVVTHTAAEVAKVIAPQFIGTSEEMIAASVERYHSIDAWCHTPVMTEEAFNALQAIMENAGTLSSRADFAKAVDNTFAAKVAAKL